MDWSPRGLWARDPISLLASVLQAARPRFGWLPPTAVHLLCCALLTPPLLHKALLTLGRPRAAHLRSLGSLTSY